MKTFYKLHQESQASLIQKQNISISQVIYKHHIWSLYEL